jgi:hypothetical protein
MQAPVLGGGHPKVIIAATETPRSERSHAVRAHVTERHRWARVAHARLSGSVLTRANPLLNR